ncbi:MAG: hypothetical protein ACFBZ8_08010 [Opitutales bacterium]
MGQLFQRVFISAPTDTKEVIPDSLMLTSGDPVLSGLREGNLFGEELLNFLNPFSELYFSRIYYNGTQKQLLLTAIALKRYWLEHGELPKTLNVLVPDYIGAVPRNPFDESQPIQYDPKRRMLWSIGSDFEYEVDLLLDYGIDNTNDFTGFNNALQEPTLVLPKW